MNVMALDLELNQPSNSIIQVGVVFGSTVTGEVYEKKGYMIFKDEEINPFITKLTTITQDQVNNGISLSEAYDDIVSLYKKYNCGLNFVTWGGGDHKAFKNELYSDKDLLCKWEFGHREFDVKTLFQAFTIADNTRNKSGLAKAMTRVGLSFEGTKHTAPDDAYNTFRLMKFLIDRLPKGVIKK